MTEAEKGKGELLGKERTLICLAFISFERGTCIILQGSHFAGRTCLQPHTILLSKSIPLKVFPGLSAWTELSGSDQQKHSEEKLPLSTWNIEKNREAL